MSIILIRRITRRIGRERQRRKSNEFQSFYVLKSFSKNSEFFSWRQANPTEFCCRNVNVNVESSHRSFEDAHLMSSSRVVLYLRDLDMKILFKFSPRSVIFIGLT